MPIYDYKCRECGKISEVFLHNPDSGPIRCPSCGSENLERIFSSSYMIRTEASAPGGTCCGRETRCDTPPCSEGGVCRRR